MNIRLANIAARKNAVGLSLPSASPTTSCNVRHTTETARETKQ